MADFFFSFEENDSEIKKKKQIKNVENQNKHREKPLGHEHV